MADPAQNKLTATDDLIRQRFDALQARKAEIEGQSASLRAKRDALHLQIGALTEKVNALTSQINEIERPEIITLSEEISKMARVLGGKAMSDNVAVPEQVS